MNQPTQGPTAAASGTGARYAWLLLLLACLPLFGIGLGAYGLLDPDEGRYASIPQQMLLFGDFVTPRQNWVKFFDKPPLLYWGIAASYSIFGIHDWAARLVPTLAALAGVFGAYALGRRMFGARAGFIGAIILATSLMWPILARLVVTDMLVSALVFGALTLWWLGHTEPNVNRLQQNSYFGGFWVILALATLAKGPIAVVLCGGCILLYVVVCKQWQAVGQMRWSWGVPLFLAIAAPWFILVAARNPEYNHYFWIDQHIGRFMGQTSGNAHREDVGYYLQFLPVIIFPWSVFVPAALVAGWNGLRSIQHTPPNEKQRAAIYLLCGISFTLIFFSSSSGKLLTYILSVVPMLALGLAAYFEWLLTRWQTSNRALSVAVGVLATILILGGGAVATLAPPQLERLGVESSVGLGIGLLLVVWAVALVVCSRRFGAGGTVVSTAGGFGMVLLALLFVVVTVMPRFTLEPLANHIRPGLANHPKSQVLTVGHIRSVPFYAERRVGILGMSGELELGVRQMSLREKRQWFFDETAQLVNLKKKMLNPYPVYVFMRISKRERDVPRKLIRGIGNGAKFIMANERFVVFGNRAALAVTPSANPASQ